MGARHSTEERMDGGKRSKFLKPGKVVILLQGRQAGKKAVIVKSYEEGTANRAYGHCIVAGIDRYPRKVTKTMGPKKVAKRSKIKTFVKVVNFNHIMPTRYGLDVDLKQAVTPDVATNPTTKVDSRKKCKALFEERYATLLKNGKSKWFYQKLRF